MLGDGRHHQTCTSDGGSILNDWRPCLRCCAKRVWFQQWVLGWQGRDIFLCAMLLIADIPVAGTDGVWPVLASTAAMGLFNWRRRPHWYIFLGHEIGMAMAVWLV